MFPKVLIDGKLNKFQNFLPEKCGLSLRNCFVCAPCNTPPMNLCVFVFFSSLGSKEAGNKLFYSPLAMPRTSQQAFCNLISSLSSRSFPSHSFVIHFFSYPLVCNTYKLPKTMFASRWGMSKWLYFLLIGAHFTDHKTESQRGPATWANPALSHQRRSDSHSASPCLGSFLVLFLSEKEPCLTCQLY